MCARRVVRTRGVKRVFAAICCDNGGMQMIVLKVLHEGEATELFPERVRCAVPVTLRFVRSLSPVSFDLFGRS